MDGVVKVFVFSSAIFGGHEMMAAKIVNAVLSTTSDRVKVLVNNEIFSKIKGVLVEGADIEIVQFKQRRFENLLGWFNPFIYQDVFRFLKYFPSSVSGVVLINGGLCANHATTLSIIILAKIKKIKICVYYPMYHDQYELGLSILKANSYNRACSRVVSLSDEFITIDEVWRKRLIEVFGAYNVKVRVINNYIVKQEFSHLRKAKLEITVPEDSSRKISKLVGFVGRFDMYQKGLDILLRVIYILDLKLDTSLEFIFLGDGPYKNEFESYIKLHPLEKIKCRFLGWVDDVPSFMRDFDVLVMTSRCEGIPTVMIESLGLGVNVVAFDIPGISKVLPESCLVEAFDEERMSQVIKDSLFTDVACKYNEEYVNSLYDYDRFINQVKVCFGG